MTLCAHSCLNDSYTGHEDCLAFAATGFWNDLRDDGRPPGNIVLGFAVEYE